MSDEKQLIIDGMVVPEDYKLKKSNEIILSGSLMDNFETKLFNLGLLVMQIEKDNNRRDDYSLTANIPVKTIKEFLGFKKSEVYRQLKEISNNLVSKAMLMFNDENHIFYAFSPITSVTFKDGTLSLVYHNSLLPVFASMAEKGNYTKLKIGTIFQFKSVWTTKLYEIIKEEQYKLKYKENKGITFNIIELRFLLGTIVDNGESQKLLNLMKEGNHDFDTWKSIFEKINKENIMFSKNNDFIRRVVLNAVSEINQKTDLEISVRPLKSGRSYDYVSFYIKENNNKGTEVGAAVPVGETFNKFSKELDGGEYEIIEKYKGYKGLSKEDIIYLYREADMDGDLVERVIQDSSRANTTVNNFMGYTISNLKNYQETGEFYNGSRKESKQTNLKSSASIDIDGFVYDGKFAEIFADDKEQVENEEDEITRLKKELEEKTKMLEKLTRGQ